MSTYYDPNVGPTAEDWRRLDHREQARVVLAFHTQNRIKGQDTKTHAYLHVAVESMLAQAGGPAVRAMHRLVAGGLSRHEAIHALAAVWLANPVGSAGNPNLSAQEQQVALNRALDALTIEEWRKLREGDEG